jgi:hypothetical protein
MEEELGDDVRLTWDASGQEVRLFAGMDVRTWAWREHAWVELDPADPPPRRSDYAVTYDAARQRHVLFGGQVYSVTDATVLGDTWELVGGAWAQVDTGSVGGPGPRYDASIGYDPDRGLVVLFGGWTRVGRNQVRLTDTWILDGSTWTEVGVSEAPPDTAGLGPLQWNPVRRRLTTVDGLVQDGELVLWELELGEWGMGDGSGATWIRAPLAVGMQSLYLDAMSYHPLRNRWVMVGSGSDGRHQWLGDESTLHPDTHPTAFEPPGLGLPGQPAALLWFPHEEVILVSWYAWSLGIITWEYQWRGNWPREDSASCANGIDEDHNGLADCADPGCEGAPCALGWCERGECAPAP